MEVIRESSPIENSTKHAINDDLTYLAGTWSNEEAEEFLKEMKYFSKIDEELW